MTDDAIPKWDTQTMRRNSRLAAFGTLIGAVMILGTFLYGSIRLKILHSELELLSEKRDQLKIEIADYEDKNADLKTERSGLERDCEGFRSILRKIDEDRETKDLVTLAKIGIKPAVRATKTGESTSDGKPIWKFEISLTFHDDRYKALLSGKISKVEYAFLHSSFGENNKRVGTDASNGWGVSYKGWGTVPVDGRIMFTDGTSALMHISMLQSIEYGDSSSNKKSN